LQILKKKTNFKQLWISKKKVVSILGESLYIYMRRDEGKRKYFIRYIIMGEVRLGKVYWVFVAFPRLDYRHLLKSYRPYTRCSWVIVLRSTSRHRTLKFTIGYKRRTFFYHHFTYYTSHVICVCVRVQHYI